MLYCSVCSAVLLEYNVLGMRYDYAVIANVDVAVACTTINATSVELQANGL